MANGKAYLIVQLMIHDREGYLAYATADHGPILDRFGGRVAAADDHAERLEGEWPYERTVVLEFPSVQLAREWYDSPDYQRLAARRQAATTSHVAILAGLP